MDHGAVPPLSISWKRLIMINRSSVPTALTDYMNIMFCDIIHIICDNSDLKTKNWALNMKNSRAYIYLIL